MTQEEEKQPQVISTPGQPDAIVPQRKNLSALPHVISNEQYDANKTLINNFRAYKLEQLQKQQEGNK